MAKLSDGLEVLVRCVDAGSLTEAARRRGVSKAALSQQLTALEKRLGARLLQRTVHGVVPTALGQEVLVHARQMLDAAQAAEAVGRQLEEPSGELRLTMPSAVADEWLVPALAHFMHQYPLLRLQIDATDRVLDLRTEPVDLALRFGWVSDGDFVARRLLQVEDTICASPGLLQEWGPVHQPEDLERLPWVLHRPFGSHHTVELHHADGRTHAFRPRARIETTASQSVLRWALAGLGLSFFLAPEVAQHLARGELVRVLPDWPSAAPNLYAVYRRDTAKRGNVARLVDHLTRHLQTAGALG